MAIRFPDITETEIAGIPTFWSDVPGPLVGTLSFRVGSAMETLRYAGVTHLVEHLALYPLAQQRYAHNGHVEDTRTVFTAQGAPDEVVAFLNHVAEQFRTVLQIDRVITERNVLRSELDQRTRGGGDWLRWSRYGPRTYGLIASDQLGLDWLSGDDVAVWAARHFNRSNAVLWLSGAPPPGLDLRLPEGTPTDLPDAAPAPGSVFPVQVPGAREGLSFSVVGDRNVALALGGFSLERALRQRLRFDEGVLYDVSGGYNPLNADVAEVVIGAGCRFERAEYVRDTVLSEIERLTNEGPAEDEVADFMDGFVRRLDHPMNVLGNLEVAAVNHLHGRHEWTLSHSYEEMRNAKATDVATQLKGAIDTSLMVLMSSDVPPKKPLTAMPMSSTHAISGREFRPVRKAFRRPKARLVIGSDGIALEGPSARSAVLFSDAVALVHAGDNEDNSRIAYSSDGYRIEVDANVWENGKEAIALIDKVTPPHLVACEAHPVRVRP